MITTQRLSKSGGEIQLRTTDLAWRRVDDDIIALDLRGSRYLRLNASAAVLWERLAESATEADLQRALIEHFGVDQERAERDVAAFLSGLRDAGLME